MGHNGCLMFCQITADEERRVSRRIVVVQHPSLVFPTIQASSCPHNPSNALKLPGKTVCLPSDHMVSSSAPSVLVGTLFKKFGLFLNTPRMTIQNYQRDTLNIIYSSNIITLLHMFPVSSTHLQEDIVVHKQHMVPSLSIRVLVAC